MAQKSSFAKAWWFPLLLGTGLSQTPPSKHYPLHLGKGEEATISLTCPPEG